MDAYDNAIFLLCGTRSNRFKALYWDKTGFVLYYKRIENGLFQWPRNQSEVKKINAHQLRRLLVGFSMGKRKPFFPVKKAALLNIDTPALHFYMNLAGVFMYNSIHAYGTEMDEKGVLY